MYTRRRTLFPDVAIRDPYIHGARGLGDGRDWMDSRTAVAMSGVVVALTAGLTSSMW